MALFIESPPRFVTCARPGCGGTVDLYSDVDFPIGGCVTCYFRASIRPTDDLKGWIITSWNFHSKYEQVLQEETTP